MEFDCIGSSSLLFYLLLSHVRVLFHATAENIKMSKYGKPNGPEISILYYVDDKRVL